MGERCSGVNVTASNEKNHVSLALVVLIYCNVQLYISFNTLIYRTDINGIFLSQK